MGAPSVSHWLAPLERHHLRRTQGIPTVTVFAGPQLVPEWAWKMRHGARATVTTAGSAEQVLDFWLRQPSMVKAMQSAVFTELAAREGVSDAELTAIVGARSVSQLDEFSASSAIQLGIPVQLVRWTLGLTDSGLCVPTEISLELLLRLGVRLPPLLVRPGQSGEALREVAHSLFHFSETAPRAELAMALDESALSVLRDVVPPRLFSGLMEGLVVLRSVQASIVADAGSLTRRSSDVSGAARSPNQACTLEYDEEQFARSLAEGILYEQLEARPRTHGLFALNQVVGDSVEIDLVCERLKLAVEVDGYHHFRDADAYRRDRRKDVRLQELGYMVVRVLASDVHIELAHVLETIDRAIEQRRRRGP